MKTRSAHPATSHLSRHRPSLSAPRLIHGTLARLAVNALPAGIAAPLLLLSIDAPPLRAQQLPAEIQVDRYMVQAERQIRNEEFAAAFRTLNRVLELYEAHDIVIPPSFWIQRAEVAMGAGQPVAALEASARYLELEGRDGEQYNEALDLLDRAFAQACTPEAMTETLEALDTCLAHGADPNEPDTSGRTPLHWAGQRDDPVIATALVEAGADSAAALAVVGTEVERILDAPICTGDYSPDSCWMEIADRPGCYLWNPSPQDDETVTWNGECSDGLAQGLGRTTWYENHEFNQVWESRRVEGKANGWAFGRGLDDEGRSWLEEACYMNDERQHGGSVGYERTIRSGYNWTWDRSFSAGERVVINMKSDEFDSYLEVLGVDGTVLVSNDDGGSGTDARLVFRAPAVSDYKIRARGYDNDDSGAFVLWVGDRDPGMTPGDPCGLR